MDALQIGDLRVKYPIVQGGMGVAISLAGLASAVANAGGIGVISAAGIGMREKDYAKNFREANLRALRKEIQKAKSLTNGVLGVNIMMALSDHEDLLVTAIKEGIDIAIMGAGLPLKMPQVIIKAGLEGHKTKLAVKVSSGKAARLIFQSWANHYNIIPDAVVVEGPMAGGHLGFKPTELEGELVPLSTLIKDTVEAIKSFEVQFGKTVPVIAAGGVYTGQDMFDIMQAGAKAVKLGTRFVTTHECDADIRFKESYINSTSKNDITIIKSPVGLPGRVINSEFVEQIKRGETKPFKCVWQCLSSCDYTKAPYCISQVLFNSAQGKMKKGFAFAGTNAYRATKIQYVAEIFEELIAGYNQAELNLQNGIEIHDPNSILEKVA
jgi:NAD(P)H-dependent flavin oxidoreductase YrpB (nitropropane dioxygenase family)